MEKQFKTGTLYIVKPNMVTIDESSSIPYYKRNYVDITRTVQFERSQKDISIATYGLGFDDVFSELHYYERLGYHHTSGDYCLNVRPQDNIKLTKYLWNKMGLQSPNGFKEIEEFIISLKPFYTTQELILILEEIKKTISPNQDKESFQLTIRKTEPIYIAKRASY